MRVSSPKVVGVSLAVSLAIAVVVGVLFSLLGGRLLAHGLGTGLFVVGLIVLGMSLLGATEPPGGWASRPENVNEDYGRRSLAARAAEDHPALDRVSSLALVVWGVAVGGTLIALSLLAFHLAAR